MLLTSKATSIVITASLHDLIPPFTLDPIHNGTIVWIESGLSLGFPRACQHSTEVLWADSRFEDDVKWRKWSPQMEQDYFNTLFTCT